MVDYDLRARAQAARMLAPKSRGGKGQEVTVRQPASGGTYDPATDSTTGGSPAQDHTGSGVEENYSALTLASGAVAAGDIKFLLSPLKADGSAMSEPVADAWTITLGGKTWTIKKVDRIAPAELPAMFELQLRA